MEITSRENTKFRELLNLTQKKHRRTLCLCLVEGEKIIQELGPLCQTIYKRGIDLAPKLFDEISSLETSQGIIATVPIPTPKSVTFPYLVLDNIQDPGNVGTLLRIAAAFGWNTVFCLNCADVWSPKVIRSSSGTQFNLNIIEDIELLPKEGTLYTADMNGAALNSIKPTGKFGLVLGNEGQGISQRIKQLEHIAVTIPIKKAAESLNVAVAGGIILYEWSQ